MKPHLNIFKNTQSALNSNKSIVLPRPTDQLWIVTDGSVKKRGIGATLYVTWHGKLLLAGFFSAKLRKHQVTWLPCEIEALGIAAAVKHFSPYIIQSSQQTCVLTDSKPCVQAIDKLCRGEFSASPRVTSFLSVVSRYQVHVKHLAGSANVPSDFASRNAPECENPTCQICTFIHITEDSVVRAINIEDVLNSKSRLPFTSRSAWKDIQSECPDLRRVHSHLLQGTRPSKKLTNVKDVKRYLNSVSIAKDGILVVKHTDPLVSSVDLIVVPRSAIDGLITALHIKLDHPSKHQILQVLKRHFYALDMSQAVERVSDMCHSCASLRKLPTGFCTQSSEDPPEVVGMSFAADVMKRNKQLVLVLRETSTSYTVASIVENERRDTIRDSLVCLCTELHPIHGPPAVIRVDAAPCFTSLRDDAILRRLNITLDIGRVKNVNKNPVGEKAIQELEDEIIRIEPDGGSLSKVQLAIAVAKLNCRIRREGLSARELWTQRNQFTHEQLPISDRNVISQQYQARLENHSASEKSKSSKSSVKASHVSVGDIVYLYSDKNKLHSRQRYLVVSKEDDWFYIKKFIGNQLRASSYKVKQNECFRVPTEIQNFNLSKCKFQQDNDSDDIDSDICVPQDNVHIPPSLTAPLGATEMPEVQSPPSVSGEMDTHEPDTETSLSLTDSTNSSLSYTNEGTELHSERPQRLRKQPKYLDDYIT
ncbi:uncharacterized protein LOC132751998 [Ruditapes philippinarum]|uniref:uncharacterized protein LOC132751998 n=1 Tax=Ruditapes philippinarum TaxID=129788 RepID=UPI00295A5E86|nr:uncharacterized protein LOC132751998 [Ruditapes philippinarum]